MTSESPLEVPAARRTRVREAAVQEIKAAARMHLARSGPTDLSLRAVARDVGVTPSALYRYFDSRAALIAALSAESLDAATRAMAQALPAPPATQAERARAAFLALRDWARANPAEFALVIANGEPETRPQLASSPELQRLVAVPLAAIVAGLQDGSIAGSAGSPALSDAALEVTRAWAEAPAAEVLARAVTLLAQCLGWLHLEHFGLVDALMSAPQEAYAAYLAGVLGIVET